MAAALTSRRGPKRVFMCTECHKAFRTREELYMHAELCLLEAFEVEASHMLADMPQLDRDPDSDASGDQTPPIKKRFLDGDAAPQLALAGEKPPALQPEKPTSKEEKERRVEENRQEEEAEKEIRKPMVYRKPAQAQLPEDSRTIESGSGLKLVVSVERAEEAGGPIDLLELEEEEDLDDLDEDVSIPGPTAPSPDSPPRVSGSGVIGALANADEDMYKPKMECPTCGLVLYRHNFSTHYRIHTGEMPFHCSYCDKRFRTTSALKVHVRAHTGEKPYICPRCSYACITKRNLDRHIINNHVREGVRRGPRYRRSRYRLHDPQYEEYMVDMARKQIEDQDEDLLDDEEDQELMDENAQDMEGIGERGVRRGEEDVSPRRSSRQQTKNKVLVQDEHTY